jgi:phage shock protein PspC (stress-responsive transcriptional regulator)
MQEILRKLSSRKLWAAVAGIVAGLAMVFGLDESIITTTTGAVVSLASVVTYIVTEGKVDAESIKNAVNAIQDAADTLRGTSGE